MEQHGTKLYKPGFSLAFIRHALALFFITCIFVAPTRSEEHERPNFVFIVIDDMNDWVGYLGGHPQAMTPNLDELASNGVAFMNAHSVSPACSPSRNAVLYGIEPYHSGLYGFCGHEIHEVLHKEYISLPRFLKSNGYRTFGAGKIHHGLDESQQEWDSYFVAEKSKKAYVADKGLVNNAANNASFRPVNNPFTELKDYQVASYGIDMISKNFDAPYFIALGLLKPHLPLECPAQFYDALPDKIVSPRILAEDLDDIGSEARGMLKRKENAQYRTEGEWPEIWRNYLACIAWTDHNVGRIYRLAALPS